jgi:hypothetical protein
MAAQNCKGPAGGLIPRREIQMVCYGLLQTLQMLVFGGALVSLVRTPQ